MSPVAGRPAGSPSAADVVLEIRGLSVDYGLGVDAVHAVVECDLTLRRGQVMGLAGESGSGKSTLSMAALRLLRHPALITKGEVLFHSKPSNRSDGGRTLDLLRASDGQLRAVRWNEISVVLQSALNALNPVITIGAQFDDLLKVHRRDLSAAERRSRAVELLELVGMTGDRLRSFPHELSGGMRQRAMIGMALALDPQLMILDEPTTALDVVTQREILEELMELRDRLGFAALFITHDLSLLVELADCFPPMHGERRPMEGIPGSPPDLRDLPPGCAFHPRCPWAMERCRREVPVLTAIAGTGREVACWLHSGGATVPQELDLPDPPPPQAGSPEPPTGRHRRAER